MIGLILIWLTLLPVWSKYCPILRCHPHDTQQGARQYLSPPTASPLVFRDYLRNIQTRSVRCKKNALCDGTSQKLACCSNLTPTQHMQYYINDSKLSYEVQCWSSPMGVCYVAICCVRMTKSNPQVCWWINRQQTTNRRVTRDKWLLAWAPRSGGNFNSSELQLLVA